MTEAITKAEERVGELRRAYGESLVAALLYGSAARGEYRPGVSDLNLLLLLSDTDPALLARGSSVVRAWAKEGQAPPVVLSEAEWRRSTDVFPIEYGEIRDAHVVLVGEDPFAGISIDREHLRLQVERELRTKQLALRERFLLAADDPEALGSLLRESFSAFMALYRSILRLAEVAVPRETDAVITEVGTRVGFDPEPLLGVRAMHDRGAPEPLAKDHPVVLGYLRAVEQTVRWLDRIS